MAQISFKIPDKELDFLKWYSKMTSHSVSTIYRDVTLDNFKEWKLGVLSSLYGKGTIGFKHLCTLGNITLQEGMLLIEMKKIDPPISEKVDLHTEEVTRKILKSLNNAASVDAKTKE